MHNRVTIVASHALGWRARKVKTYASGYMHPVGCLPHRLSILASVSNTKEPGALSVKNLFP